MYLMDVSIKLFFSVSSFDFKDIFSNEVDDFKISSFIVFRFFENIDDFIACSLNMFDVSIVSVFMKKIVLIIVARVSCICDTD